MLSLSIVIPNYNGLDHLKRCLPSVCRFAPAGTQIIMVDDASKDSSVTWTRRHFPGVEVLQLAENKGFCGAVNAGIESADGDVVELLNNDTEVREGWAQRSLEHFDDPSIGSVAPLVVQLDRPEIIDSAGMEYHLCGWAYNRGYGRKLDASYQTRCTVFGASGSAGFFRRAALQRTGPLLADYNAYFEDVDLAFRLRWAGYRCVYEPEACVLHLGSASYQQQSRRVTQLLARNEELAFWINMPLPDLLLALVPHFGFMTVRMIRHALTGRFLPFVAGKWQALKSCRRILQLRANLRQLAKEAPRPREMALKRNLGVVAAGVHWLRRRESA
jgi:O-antigen biosynthesis protein